jgi:hypothetical protein
MSPQRTTLIRRAATPAEVQAGRPAWYGEVIEKLGVHGSVLPVGAPSGPGVGSRVAPASSVPNSYGVADRCACPETGNDPEALLARWAYEDAIDNAAKQP